MLKNHFFRDNAVQRNAQPEPLDNLLRVTAPREWMLLLALAASLLAAVAWFALARVEQTVSGAGVLVQAGERRVVSAPVSGVVSQIMARSGDRVEAGQTIAGLHLPDLDWRLRVARARVASLEALASERDGAEAAWAGAALADARAEMIELAAAAAEGQSITSPYSGEITNSGLSLGNAVIMGETVVDIRLDAAHSLEAVMMVPAGWERRIAVGMTARVTPGDRPASEAFSARVHSLSPPHNRANGALSRLLPDTGERQADGWLARLVLDGAPDLGVADGWPCRIQIVLESDSPIGLMLPSASGAE